MRKFFKCRNRTIMGLKLNKRLRKSYFKIKSQSNHYGIETIFEKCFFKRLLKSQSNHYGIETKLEVVQVAQVSESQLNHYGIETKSSLTSTSSSFIVAIEPLWD